MNIEKKYRITKCLLIILSILMFVSFYVLGTYIDKGKEEARQARILRGTYVSADTFTNLALDDETSCYYLSGKEVSNGRYEKLHEQVYKLVSGKLKNSYIMKDSGGDIILIKNDSVTNFKKNDNTILRMEK